MMNISQLSIEKTPHDSENSEVVSFLINGQEKARFSLEVGENIGVIVGKIERSLQGLPKELDMTVGEILKLISIIIPEFGERVNSSKGMSKKSDPYLQTR